jgi:small-conductance mechanosensitive channel
MPTSNYRHQETYSYEPDDDYTSSSDTSYSTGSTNSGGEKVTGYLVVIVIIAVILYWLGGRTTHDNTANTSSQPVIAAQPAHVLDVPDTGKAVTEPSDSINSPVRDLVIGENFLQKDLVYRFVKMVKRSIFLTATIIILLLSSLFLLVITLTKMFFSSWRQLVIFQFL